jgi:hypothetical protein
MREKPHSHSERGGSSQEDRVVVEVLFPEVEEEAEEEK